MSRVELAPAARLDLYDIWESIALDNPEAAREWVDRLHEAFESLAQMPGMGRSQEHRRPNLRSWPVGSYLVFYRPKDGGIEVARILHGRRDLDSLL